MKLYSDDGRRKITIGEIIDDTLYKKVKPEHFLIKHNGWAIQKNVFDKLKVHAIVIEGKEKYRATLATWKAWGEEVDYGFGVQRVLDKKYMEKV